MLWGLGGLSYSLCPVLVLFGLFSQICKASRLVPADEKRQFCNNKPEARSMGLEPDSSGFGSQVYHQVIAYPHLVQCHIYIYMHAHWCFACMYVSVSVRPPGTRVTNNQL